MTSEQTRLLLFAIKYSRGWHSCDRRDRRAIRAMDALAAKSIIEVNRHGRGINPQFRLALPDATRRKINADYPDGN
jgi:hypothetical protein